MNILDISELISKALGIDNEILRKILEDKLSPEQLSLNFENDEKMVKIKSLLEKDANILKFGDDHIKGKSKENFIKLKNSLGKLQILVLINDIKKSKDCNDVLDSFMKVFNDKIDSVNTILEDNLTQKGGNNNNIYIKKYLKYKIKYLKYKIKYLKILSF